MRTIELTDNLIQLSRMGGLLNAYLVREEDGFTLIDTTMGGRAADELLGAATDAGGAIRRIALTHGHGDHVGGLDALRAKLGSDVPVLMGAEDARIHAGGAPPEGSRKRGSWPSLSTVPEPLTAGERLGSLEAIASPGHTPGHLAFLDTRDRSLIAGDAFTSIGGVAVPSHFYWRFPVASFATSDPTRALRSARELRALDPSLLAVGHGPAVRDPGAAMDAAIARAS
jgi:glyoxylase-like metal-dependent hydrolase (beta-lactamase superfamily II)